MQENNRKARRDWESSAGTKARSIVLEHAAPGENRNLAEVRGVVYLSVFKVTVLSIFDICGGGRLLFLYYKLQEILDQILAEDNEQQVE